MDRDDSLFAKFLFLNGCLPWNKATVANDVWTMVPFFLVCSIPPRDVATLRRLLQVGTQSGATFALEVKLVRL